MSTPAHLDAVAAGLRHHARDLAAVLRSPLARAGRDVWQGPAQVRVYDGLLGRRNVLAAVEGELTGLAFALEAEAAAARAAEVARRAVEEARLRDAAAGGGRVLVR